MYSLKADIHTCGRGHVAGVTIDREGSSIQNGEVRPAKVQQLLVCGPDEHVVHEQSMVCSGTHHTNLDPGLQCNRGVLLCCLLQAGQAKLIGA